MRRHRERERMHIHRVSYAAHTPTVHRAVVAALAALVEDQIRRDVRAAAKPAPRGTKAPRENAVSRHNTRPETVASATAVAKRGGGCLLAVLRTTGVESWEGAGPQNAEVSHPSLKLIPALGALKAMLFSTVTRQALLFDQNEDCFS